MGTLYLPEMPRGRRPRGISSRSLFRRARSRSTRCCRCRLDVVAQLLKRGREILHVLSAARLAGRIRTLAIRLHLDALRSNGSRTLFKHRTQVFLWVEDKVKGDDEEYGENSCHSPREDKLVFGSHEFRLQIMIARPNSIDET